MKAQEQQQPQRVQAVVSDWQMPQGTGLELLDQMRKGAGSDIAFVLMSGAVNEEELKGALKFGPDAVILKPFNLDALTKKIDEAIVRREYAAYRAPG